MASKIPPPFPPSDIFSQGDVQNCPVEKTLKLVTGKWRLMILFRLGGAGQLRWAELRRALKPITPRVLTATLRDLEADGLVWRKSEHSVPPVVTYGLTERGEGLSTVFAAMADWGLQHLFNER